MAALLVVTALALTACGGGSSTNTASENPGQSTTTKGNTDSGSGSGSGSGSVDCAKVKASAAIFLVQVQFLAQLRTKDAYSLIKDGTVEFDPAKMATIIDDLRAVQDVDLSPLQPAGAVKAALDKYAAANDLAKQNLAVDDPFTQAKGQELADMTKDIADFLGGQAAISEAISKACP